MATDLARDPWHSYGSEAARRAAEDTERTRQLVAAVRATPQPIAGMGAWGVLVTGAWLLLGEFALSVPYTATGSSTAVRDQGFAIAVLLVGMFLKTHPGNMRAATLLVLLGVLLVASGIWLPHQAGREMVDEIVTGAFLVCAALAATVRRGDDHTSHA